MSEDRTLTWSQQWGYEEVPGPLRLEELPPEARTKIWNVLYEQLPRTAPGRGAIRVGGIWRRILYEMHTDLDARPADEWGDRFDKTCAELKGRILDDPFNRVFNLIRFIMTHPNCPTEFISGVSSVFRRLQLAYTIVTGPDGGSPAEIVPAGPAEDGKQLVRNLAELRSAGLDGCTTHLRNASRCIHDRDWAGSVRESIHAVESVARQIDPEASKTLGPALASLEKRSTLHPALKRAFNSLYGYTNREQGIRHALLDNAQANVTIDEAVFMLGACASFASYLWRKHKATTAP